MSDPEKAINRAADMLDFMFDWSPENTAATRATVLFVLTDNSVAGGKLVEKLRSNNFDIQTFSLAPALTFGAEAKLTRQIIDAATSPSPHTPKIVWVDLSKEPHSRAWDHQRTRVLQTLDSQFPILLSDPATFLVFVAPNDTQEFNIRDVAPGLFHARDNFHMMLDGEATTNFMLAAPKRPDEMANGSRDPNSPKVIQFADFAKK